jgi:hypothetical protein
VQQQNFARGRYCVSNRPSFYFFIDDGGSRVKRRDVLKLAGASTVVAALPGCGGGDEGELNIRLLNLLAGAGDITLRLDGNNKTSASFETASGYFGADEDTYTTEFVSNASGAVLYSVSNSYSKDVYYTLTSVGVDGTSGYAAFVDNEERPSDNVVKVRLSNLVTNGLSYDLFLTAASADLNAASPTLNNVAVGSTTGFAEPGSSGYRVRMTKASTREVVFDSIGAFDFSSREVITLILYAVGSSELVNCFALFGKDNPGRSVALANGLSRVRLVNGTDLTDRLRVTASGASIFNGVPADAASSHQAVGAGAKEFSITTQAGTVVVQSLAGTLAAGQDHTLIVSGAAGSYSATLAQETNTRPRAGYTKLKVTNAVRDGASAELSVNYRTDFAALAVNTVSSAREYTPAVYSFSAAFTVGAVTKSVDFPAVELEADKSYIANLFGDDAKRTLIITEVI